jgi:hypothetical protein
MKTLVINNIYVMLVHFWNLRCHFLFVHLTTCRYVCICVKFADAIKHFFVKFWLYFYMKCSLRQDLRVEEIFKYTNTSLHLLFAKMFFWRIWTHTYMYVHTNTYMYVTIERRKTIYWRHKYAIKLNQSTRLFINTCRYTFLYILYINIVWGRLPRLSSEERT